MATSLRASICTSPASVPREKLNENRHELQDPILQRDFGLSRSQRKIARDDRIGAITNVGVHLAQAHDIQRGVRQHPPAVAGGEGFFRGRRRFFALRARTDQRSKIVEVQFARCDIAGEIGTFAGRIEGEHAMQIAVSDLAAQIGDAPVVDVALKIPGKPVGRRVGQRQTSQIIKIGEV